MLNDEIISTLEKKFETFSESIGSRLLNIEEQIIGARDSRIEKIGDDNSDNASCLNLFKNRISELERQIKQGDAVINFLSDQIVNKSLNGDFDVNKTVNDLITVLKRELIILLVITSLWSNIMIKIKKKKLTLP